MPIKLKLESERGNGLWSAFGTLEGKDKANKDMVENADVLLLETNEGLSLVLDETYKISSIGGKKILKFINAQPVILEKVRKGASVEFKNVWVNLKTIS